MNLELFNNVSVGVYELKLNTDINIESALQISKEIDILNEWEAKEIILRINSPGGYVISTYNIITSITESKAKVTTVNEGLAASSAGNVFVVGDVREMRDYARLMIHDPSLGSKSLSEMKAGKAKTMLLNYKDSIATILSKNSTLTKDEVSKLMTKETWINAEQALEWGLIDKIIETPQRVPNNITENKLESKEDINDYLTACSNFLDNNSNNNQKSNEMDNEKVISLKEDAFKNEAKIESLETALNLKESNLLEVQDELKKEKDEVISLKEQLNKSSENVIALKEKLNEVEKAKVSLYVDGLIENGYDKEARDKLIEIGIVNFEHLKLIVSSVPKPKEIKATDLINNKEEGLGERKHWDLDKWMEEDRAGLDKIEKENPALFNEIVIK